MKHLVSLSFLVVCFLISCQNAEESKAVVTQMVGHIAQPGAGNIYLENISTGQAVVEDTIVLDENNTFAHDLSDNKEGLYRLNINGQQIINLIISDESIKVEANGAKNGAFQVTGSEEMRQYNQLAAAKSGFDQDVRALNQKFLAAKNAKDEVTANAIQEEYMQMNDVYEGKLKDMIKGMGGSLAAYFGTTMIDKEKNFAFMKETAAALNEKHGDLPIIQTLAAEMSKMGKLAIGSPAPEITLPTVDGKMMKLSDLRGNYVMIDFWAAWCGPCRRENPNVVRVYNKYHSKGFEILGVSLDKTKDKWVQAIAKDGLEWPHVSDLKYWQSAVVPEYNIKGIPLTYLIDPEGNIVAKGLRGNSLEKKLAEIYEG